MTQHELKELAPLREQPAAPSQADEERAAIAEEILGLARQARRPELLELARHDQRRVLLALRRLHQDRRHPAPRRPPPRLPLVWRLAKFPLQLLQSSV